MATITAYQTAAGKRYRVRYRKPDGAQTDKRGFKTKREADTYLASVTIAKATGEYIDPQLGKITIEQFAPTWLAGKKSVVKPSQYASLDSSWRTHVEPEWGHRQVSSIKPSEVQQWIATLSDQRSATVVIRAHGVLAGILDLAVADRRIPKNQARGLRLPKKKPKGRTYLTHDQVHQLAAKSTHSGLVLTLAYTGLRWGEATGLRVKHVNQLRRRLSIVENAVWVGNQVHTGSPKPHERRTVPYPKFLGSILADLAKGKGPNDLLFGDGITHLRQPHSGHSWLAAAIRTIQAEQQKLIDEAAEQGEELDLPLFPKVTPHELRHTAASLAVSAGANVKALQRMLGHASAAMTLDTYADLFDDDLDVVADALEKAAAEQSVGKVWANVLA